MRKDFAETLDFHIKRSRLSLRHIAHDSGIPHQTIFNWTKGVTPRWHPSLIADIHKLADTLHLVSIDTNQLLVLSGCLSNIGSLNHKIKKGRNEFIENGDEDGDRYIELDLLQAHELNISKVHALDSPYVAYQTLKADYYRCQRLQLSMIVQFHGFAWFHIALATKTKTITPEELCMGDFILEERRISFSGKDHSGKYILVSDILRDCLEISLYMAVLVGEVRATDIFLKSVGKDIPLEPTSHKSFGVSG